MIQNYSNLNKQFSFLVLDYERPKESLVCLESIREKVKFDNYEVVFYSNGGNQDYVIDFYNRGLIDRCILNSKNEGTGFGTMKLIQSCATDYFMSIQCDNYIKRDFHQEELDSMINMLKNTNVSCIDLAYADVKNNNFSERCYVMETDFYNANPNQVGGGPGPYIDLFWTEESTQEWIKNCMIELGVEGERKRVEGLVFHWDIENSRKEYGSIQTDLEFAEWMYPRILVGNSGKYTVRSCKHGGEYKFRNDSQQLWILKKPSKKSYFGKDIAEWEWEKILKGKWEDGSVPERQAKHINNFWGEPTTFNKDKGVWEW